MAICKVEVRSVYPNSIGSLEEVLDFFSLSEEFVSGLLDLGNAIFVFELESMDNAVLAVGSGAWEGEDETLGDTVGLAISVGGDALPFVASKDPVAHVVDSSVSCGCS